MEDLSAASHDDVVEFFKTYYAPNNASLVIAGDIDSAATRRLVEKWFSEIPRGPAVAADRAAGRGPRRRQEADDDRPRAAAAAVPRVAHARCVSARRRGDGHRLEPADRRQERAAVSTARLRPADRAGRQRLSAVAGARQRLHDHRDGAARAEPREDSAGDRRGARQAAIDAGRRSRDGARDEPDRGQLLSPDGARRRVLGARPIS